MDAKFKDKVTVVSGGASGIGNATASGFANAGARVAILDINREVGEKVAAELPGAAFFQCDLRDVSAIKRAFGEIAAAMGEVDIMVNCAGLANRTPIVDTTEEEWDLLNDVNLKATFFCAQQAAVSMLRGGKGGRIVNIGSHRARLTDDRHTIYAATKAAVQAVARGFGVAFARDGITVNTISPGYVLSPMTSHNLQNKEWLDWVTSRIPMGRLIEFKEVVAAIMFLCSPEASGITGQNLYVDGGWTAHE